MKSSNWIARAACTLISAALSAGITPAETAAAPAEPASMTAEERIAALERRVAELEEALKKALAQGETAETRELRRRLDLLAQEMEQARIGDAARAGELRSVYGLGPAASKVYSAPQGVSIGGYGEALFEDYDATRDNGSRTGRDSRADFLRAVFYFGWKFNDRIVFNSEIEFEHASTGENGEVSVEFATLDFLLREEVNVRAGMVLLPVGILNEMHEPPTFLGSRRPDVERNVIPSTWRENGVGVFGDLGDVSYRAYVVNGLDAEGFTASSGLRSGRQDGSEASARDIAFVARADYRGVPGLLAGASFYTGDSGQGAEDPNGDVIHGTVTLYDLHAEYRFRGLQARALWSSTSIDDAAEVSALAGETIGSRIRGWYLEAGYDLLAGLGETTGQSITPFVRYERYDTQDRVASGFVTTGANDAKVITYGAVWKPIFNVAIKADYQDIDRGDGSGTDQVNVALGYLF